MSQSRRPVRGLLAAAIVLAAVLSGCGATDPDPATSEIPSLTVGEIPAPAQRAPSSAGPAPSAPATNSVPSVVADAFADPAAVTVVVNKRRPLDPIDYVPDDLVLPAVALAVDQANATLRPDAAQAVEEMYAAAAADDVGLTLVSGYRSYPVQVDTYNYWVSLNGSAENADNYSARPGFSEHQTGLAFDIGQDDGACTLRSCFAETAAAAWAAENAHRFGFILRYPEGRQDTTGFLAESWHYRFVGAETSTSMWDDGVQTLEEYFGLPDAPDYG
ncbi:D-alanyl-D-alanine carboxypeptidase [Arthrobacter sp. CAN_A212]|uniref:M15 family metallopeptidase n=1 Tax=unclassified Arthrobacter TaxID=235627 RepID=UPI001A250C10|nr:D-alanyl-D-alanine carboxypeptidase family protein [Arthrobacter sp. CAN_C5]MBP2215740.1 D-alanyl-D-alanine carboxypeptidase [Arthrobacter sp. CAN_C5]